MSIPVNNDIDNPADESISSSLQLSSPKSFFLFAGAGSGKTRSLVNALLKIRSEQGYDLRVGRQNVAVITYTNAACDEIIHRLGSDKLFSVSTIHSFIWELIKHYPADIRGWLRVSLQADIAELNDLQSRARGVNKSYTDRARKIESKTKRLQRLDGIKRFTYNPNGDNTEKHSLNHSEVIGIGANFLQNKVLMQQILIKKFPILLIDESQDTNKHLITAFFEVQKLNPKSFSLGLFGDTMQRIYFDGKEDLGVGLPADWNLPAKLMNHRCAKRIITLINKIRAGVDGREQIPRSDKDEGFVRFFVVASAGRDKNVIEEQIAMRMAAITSDSKWKSPDQEIKALILEHHMAANRLGFLELYSALNEVDRFKTGLSDGTLPGLRLFTDMVLPLIAAKKSKDEFAVARIIRDKSSLLSYKTLKEHKNPDQLIRLANKCVNELYSLWKTEQGPKLLDVLKFIAETNLFPIPDSLQTISGRTLEEHAAAVIESESGQDEGEETVNDDAIDAWDSALSQNFNQIEAYYKYVSGASKFDTHQGVKGREFPRVMMIIDDDARGFQFSYDKLFGVKELTDVDHKNAREGKDTSVERTKRLFYVGCSRAEKSLAIVAYSSRPEAVKGTILANKWFSEGEVEIL